MDIYEWNAVFVLMGGSVVCSGCMMAQELVDEREHFPHADGCKHNDDDTNRPWQTLHELLDKVRG